MAPESWRVVKLGEVMTATVGGGTPDRSNLDYWGGSIPWATVKDFGPRMLFEPQERITEKGLRNSASNLVPANTVVVATRMNVGAVFRSGIPIAINQDLRALLPAENLLGEYLFYFLQSNGKALSRMATGTTVKGIRVNSLKSLPLPLPPLPEQRKIAAILSSLDDAIEKTQAIIDQVQVVKRSLMQELLTIGLPGRHRQFKQTVIGGLPETWAVSTVNAVAAQREHSCVGGPFGSDLTRKDYVDFPGVPVIRGSNLSAPSARLNENEFVFVSEAKANALQRNMAFPGDLVFTQRGTLGQVCRIPIQSKFRRYVLSQSQMKVSVDEKQVNPEFLLAYFRSPMALKLIEAMTIGTGVPHLNLWILKGFPVPVPSLDEQSAIVNHVSATDARVESEVLSLRGLTELRTGLMSVLLSGELRVAPDSEAA